MPSAYYVHLGSQVHERTLDHELWCNLGSRTMPPRLATLTPRTSAAYQASRHRGEAALTRIGWVVSPQAVWDGLGKADAPACRH